MDEGGGLENRCAVIRHRGFESLPLRHRQAVVLPAVHFAESGGDKEGIGAFGVEIAGSGCLRAQ